MSTQLAEAVSLLTLAQVGGADGVAGAVASLQTQISDLARNQASTSEAVRENLAATQAILQALASRGPAADARDAVQSALVRLDVSRAGLSECEVVSVCNASSVIFEPLAQQDADMYAALSRLQHDQRAQAQALVQDVQRVQCTADETLRLVRAMFAELALKSPSKVGADSGCAMRDGLVQMAKDVLAETGTHAGPVELKDRYCAELAAGTTDQVRRCTFAAVPQFTLIRSLH